MGPLTAPGTAAAASGAGSGTSQRCAPASGPRAAGGVEGGSSRGTGAGVEGRGGATHRDPRCCGAAGRLWRCVVCLLGQADVSLKPVGAEPETRGRACPPATHSRPHAHLYQQRAAAARAAPPATAQATMSTVGSGSVRAGFTPGPCRPARPDLPRARPTLSPRVPRDFKGDTCTGPDDAGEPKEVRGVGAGAPGVEGRPRSGPCPPSESPRVAAAERRQVVTAEPGWGQGRGRRAWEWGRSLTQPLGHLRLGQCREPPAPCLLPG